MNFKKFSVDLAKEAGKITKDAFFKRHITNWKQDDSPVSEVDLQIDNLVNERIKLAFPDHGILSEESDETASHSEYVWVCDPIDGTFPYMHGMPSATFSLALVKNGVPILGVIYDSFLDRLFFAEKGKGAELNGVPMSVSKVNTLQKTIVGISLWLHAPYNLAPLMGAFQAELALPINLAANIYMSALVASGNIGGVIYNDTKPHDAAAVKIIVEEAGGKVTDLYGNEQRYDAPITGMVASNGLLHQQILDIIQAHKEQILKKMD